MLFLGGLNIYTFFVFSRVLRLFYGFKACACVRAYAYIFIYILNNVTIFNIIITFFNIYFSFVHIVH